MKRLKLRRTVIPTLVAAVGLLTTVLGIAATKEKEREINLPELNYVSSIILSEEIPVISTVNKVINPYTDESVKIGKTYYDYTSTSEEQEQSIIYHENTYMQNSGIDFVAENTFSVVAVLDGTISNIKEDELLGKIIEINHNNEYMSVYQSLNEINVKKGDYVAQGQIIGTSGTNKLDKDLGNHLHFEFYSGGQIVNPSLYLNKELKKVN